MTKFITSERLKGWIVNEMNESNNIANINPLNKGISHLAFVIE